MSQAQPAQDPVPPPPTSWPALPDPTLIDRVLDIMAEKAKLDRALLVPGAKMDELNIPSLDMVDILFEVEEQFGIYIPMGEEMSDTVYLYDLIQVLADQVAGGGPEASAP